MGWNSTNYNEKSQSTFEKKDAFMFLSEEFMDFKIEKFHFEKGNQVAPHECYFVAEHKVTNRKFIVCTIINIKDGEIYWKDIPETMSPCYYNCPASFFEGIEPENYAAEWRERCSEKPVKL